MSFRARATISYVALAAAWILFSDQVLDALISDPHTLSVWQSIKGLAFVGLTAGLVFWLSGLVGKTADTAVTGDDRRTVGHAMLIPAAAALVTLAITVAAIAQIESGRVQQRRAVALDRAEDHSHALQVQIRMALSATNALAALLRRGDGRIEHFEALATELLPLYPGVSALALAPNGVITQIHPRTGNEGAIGIDILNDPQRRGLALNSMRSRQVTVAGPLRLSSGEIGLIGRLAVFAERGGREQFWGFVTALTPLEAVTRAGNLPQLADAGYDYELRSDTTVLDRSGSGPLADAVTSEISLPGATWTLRVVPRDGWYSGRELVTEGLLAILFSGLVAYLIHVLIRQPVMLRAQVAQRTRELAAASHRLNRLHQAVEQSPATVVITDRHGLMEYVNPKFTEVTGYAREEAIGQNPRLIKSGLTPDSVYEAMWRALDAGNEWRGELCNRRKDGSLFWEFEVIAPVRDDAGQISHFIAVKEDVTERHHAAARLERLNRTLRVISQVNGALGTH